MSDWNPNQYLAFANERTQPSIDLVARITLESPRRIIDLGCGPGNSTAVLKRRWPGAHVLGLDNSAKMIEAARAADPMGEYTLADIATWTASELYDLVFSNATLQWLPDHVNLLPRLLSQVVPGGALAVQMPSTAHGLFRQLVMQTADASPHAMRLQPAKAATRTELVSTYYDVLRPHCASLALWETEYGHVLGGHTAIIEWIKGTALQPYLAALPDDAARSTFLADLLRRVQGNFALNRDGTVLFPFRRTFVIAYQRR